MAIFEILSSEDLDKVFSLTAKAVDVLEGYKPNDMSLGEFSVKYPLFWALVQISHSCMYELARREQERAENK